MNCYRRSFNARGSNRDKFRRFRRKSGGERFRQRMFSAPVQTYIERASRHTVTQVELKPTVKVNTLKIDARLKENILAEDLRI
jgi:hypothetical protein